MKFKGDICSTKVRRIREGGDVKNKLDSVVQEAVGIDSVTGEGIEFDKEKSASTMLTVTQIGSFDIISEQPIEKTQSGEQQKDDVKIWKKVKDEEIKSLQNDLKNCIELQKDTIKSYLNMKKDVSALKEQFEMVYGKNVYPHRK